MILVTSHRPLKDCSPEILRNQLRARESWEGNFTKIVFFGKYEAALSGPQVFFLDCEGFPHIQDMMAMCATAGDWCAIVNADIVVGRGMPIIKKELLAKNAQCAMSRRFEFEGEAIDDARMLDNGLDFFAATPSVWGLAATLVPKQYRIGHILWDTWTIGFLASHYYNWFWDITECRVIFHPKHEDRRRIFEIDKHEGQEQLGKVQWPSVNRRLRIKAIADATGTKPEHFT